jgi:hypothetical protein
MKNGDRTATVCMDTPDVEAGEVVAAGARAGRRWVAAVCGLVVAGAVAAGCGGGSGSSTPPASPAQVTATQHVTSTPAVVPPAGTTTTLPAQCGSPRDPLDPTNTPPPSPAAC